MLERAHKKQSTTFPSASLLSQPQRPPRCCCLSAKREGYTDLTRSCHRPIAVEILYLSWVILVPAAQPARNFIMKTAGCRKSSHLRIGTDPVCCARDTARVRVLKGFDEQEVPNY